MKRVQRKRTKGFKLPENTVCVNRGTKWGNDFKVGGLVPSRYFDRIDEVDHSIYAKTDAVISDNLEAVRLFNRYQLPILLDQIEELKGKNLACFCPLDKPCHADSLIKLANKNT